MEILARYFFAEGAGLTEPSGGRRGREEIGRRVLGVSAAGFLRGVGAVGGVGAGRRRRDLVGHHGHHVLHVEHLRRLDRTNSNGRGRIWGALCLLTKAPRRRRLAA